MRLDLESCLKTGKLKKIKPDPKLVFSELKEADSDLRSAKNEIKLKNWKWAVEKAYYAMFHAARALLILKGYKERSHTCLLVALKKLYIEKGELPRKYFDFIETAKFRREEAVYASHYSKEIAITHMKNASMFVLAVKKIINKKGFT